MTSIQAQTSVRNLAERQHGRPLVGKQARERLLAGMPVTEGRLELAGISTAVLAGGDGASCCMGRENTPPNGCG
jgi:hypothetical protein